MGDQTVKITLQPEDFRAFLAALYAPIQPNSALKKAMKLHSGQAPANESKIAHQRLKEVQNG